jgi:hypothetical protein
MSRHLAACRARKAAIAAESALDGPRVRLFHLYVKATYWPDHWLHIEVPARATLRDLDQFLRDIWLECCGHMSMFRIDDGHYISDMSFGWWNDDDFEMADFELGQVLEKGLEFTYEYDFGTSTDLTLRNVSERDGVMERDDTVRLMGRNNPLDFFCSVCEKPATVVCTFCDYVLLCDACSETHACGEDGLLPVVNSPRMGMCGYTGDVW